MKGLSCKQVRELFAFLGLGWAIWAGEVCAQTAGVTATPNGLAVSEIENLVEVRRAGTQTWERIRPGTMVFPGDRVRVSERSRAALSWPDQRVARFIGPSEAEILPPNPVGSKPSPPGLRLLKSALIYLLQRAAPDGLPLKTPAISAAVEGTEFEIRVTDNEETILTVIDGRVIMTNEQGRVELFNGQQGRAFPGQAPVLTAALPVINDLIQWTFYYPAVLNVDELPLDPNAQDALRDSLAAYRAGDLLAALASYSPNRQPASPGEQLYLAELLLSVGKVEAAEQLLPGPGSNLTEADPTARLAGALRTLIAAVKLQTIPGKGALSPTNALSTEWLADSYYWQAAAKGDQSEANLRRALNNARAAVDAAPNFGYAWERLAEMEFSFGRVSEAGTAVSRSLGLAPRNAQGLALRGFLLAAAHRFDYAIASFDDAIKVDGALGNAWLGRGLCLIHQGQVQAGRDDLLMAATLEPQRSILRSYLGKAYANEGDTPRATRELRLANGLDPKDPTPFLYSALLNQENSRINEAIRDLEKSQELNDNRSLYRSRLSLEEDRAVRSANLARIFSDDNMTDVSLREAVRSVQADYANYSAHLFLANSYDQMRDPNFVNLRLETAANSEYLIANLLAPVGGGIFNPAISQQEYSRLFEQNRLGVVSTTDYLSRGAWIENGAQYGIFDSTSYSIGAFYRADPGQRPNNDVEQRQLYFQLKQQLTPKDSVYLEGSQLEITGGDLFQYYDNVSLSPQLRTQETQEPLLTVGYHREWSPGQHTLLLASWVNDDYRFSNPSFQSLLTATEQGVIQSVRAATMSTDFRNRLNVYTVEPQHIWEQDGNVAIIGGRYQGGDFHTENLQTVALTPGPGGFFSDPAASQDLTSDFERFSVYAYDQYEVVSALWLTAGIAYDRVTFPQNLFAPPASDRTTTQDQVSPKAGLVWTAPSLTTVRFGYGRSLTGASLDQSVRIEPTQVAGFNQALRSLIPESVAGSIPGARIETYGVSIEQKLTSGTYLGLSGEIADSEAGQTIGAFDRILVEPPPPAGTFPPPATPSTLTQKLDYGEKSVRFTIDQLVGKEWALGARYQLTYSDLASVFPEIPQTAPSDIDQRQSVQSLLHQIGLTATFNHDSGVFSQLEADWYSQSNHGYVPSHPGDTFWQINLFAGYRFPRRRAEIALGLLNLTDTDYHLDPLTFYSELPRSRTFVARLRFSF